MDIGVFVVGMDRSGTSAVTRLVSLHGLHLPVPEDLIQAREENPKGVWESASLANLNVRVLTAVGSDERFPVVLEVGWEDDPRLGPLRSEARETFRRVFPAWPWVWKDPWHCLTFAFWRSALDVRPVVVLVNRNPLEIAASAQRAWNREKIFGLALWERYLRQALGQIAGLPVLVTNYADIVSSPLVWSERMHAFLTSAGVPARAPAEDAVVDFVDRRLRHAAFSSEDVRADRDVSDPQRDLFFTLMQLEGQHESFSAPVLPDESPTTEPLLAERRRAFRMKDQLERLLESEQQSRLWPRIRGSRYAAPVRPLIAALRSRLRRAHDTRPPLHVLHVGKTGGTALKHVLMEHEAVVRYRLRFRGHDVGLASLPPGERFMFLVRDPLTRFVSAFNGRFREDRPRYHYPWRDEERVAFARFRTPDQLATALSSDDEAERRAAEEAMRGIGHVNTPYSFWFGDEETFRAHLPDVFFIGFQDRLDEDFEVLRRKLGLPEGARLPADPTAAHRAPPEHTSALGATARANLEKWYERDIAFVRLCRELAPSVNAAP